MPQQPGQAAPSPARNTPQTPPPRPQPNQPQAAGIPSRGPQERPQERPQGQQQDRPQRDGRQWDRTRVKVEETYEDVKKENDRIEKEIWLEIAEIRNIKLD